MKKRETYFHGCSNVIRISREKGKKEIRKSDISILSISHISIEMLGKFVFVHGLRGRIQEEHIQRNIIILPSHRYLAGYYIT